MLAGLLTYGAGTLLALLATQFETLLLLARVIAAFIGRRRGFRGDPDQCCATAIRAAIWRGSFR